LIPAPWLAITLAAAMCAGCDETRDAPPASPEPRGGIPLAPAPRVVVSFCKKTRKPVPVLCPTVFPRRAPPAPPPDRRDLSGRDFTPSRYAGYLVNFNDPRARTRDLGHVVLAAQPRRFSLDGAPGADWPRAGQRPDAEMRIGAAGTVVRRTAVHGRPAIVVRSKPYPAGGIHGGHVVVAWNEGGDGYLVSLHYIGGRERYDEAQRIGAALTIARSARH
jgi:hypothetical protein